MQKSDSTFRSIFDHSADGIALADGSGIVREWSNGYEQISGLSKELVIGKMHLWDVSELLFPFEKQSREECEKEKAELKELVATMQHKTIIRHVKHCQTGDLRIFNILYFPVAMPAGEMMFCGISRDITEEVRSRELLEENERKYTAEKQRLETLSDNLPEGTLYRMIFERDTGKNYMEYVSGTWERITGLTPESVAEDATLFDNNVHPEDRSRMNHFIKLTIKNLSNFNVDVRINKKGKFRWLRISSKPYEDDNKIIWDGIMTDITDRKEAEQRQAILIKVLQIMQSPVTFPQAMNISLAEIGEYAGVSRVYIFEKSADETTVSCTYEWCNTGIIRAFEGLQNMPIKVAQSLFDKFNAGEILNTSDIYTLHPDVVKIVDKLGVKSTVGLPLSANGVTYGFVGFDECTVNREWEQNEIELLKSLSQIISTATRRYQAEMDLISSKEKAEESDNLKSAFLANVSHEIRTPLNAITGFLRFLSSDDPSPALKREYISIINNSSAQLVKLIDDIVDMAKIEAKQLNMHNIPLDINSLMKEMQMFFETYLQSNDKKNIALILDDSEFIDNCVALTDPLRLRQVLNNLISNAIKFTEKGYIRFGYRQPITDYLEFFVEDTGIGINPAQHEIIFDRFRQVDPTNSRLYRGTGIGLNIASNLVQLMGGKICVESTEGVGASFYFTVSYRPVADEG